MPDDANWQDEFWTPPARRHPAEVWLDVVATGLFCLFIIGVVALAFILL